MPVLCTIFLCCSHTEDMNFGVGNNGLDAGFLAPLLGRLRCFRTAGLLPSLFCSSGGVEWFPGMLSKRVRSSCLESKAGGWERPSRFYACICSSPLTRLMPKLCAAVRGSEKKVEDSLRPSPSSAAQGERVFLTFPSLPA